MTVRLAFSVAAHLQAEIILVDEVLAVGDVISKTSVLPKWRVRATMGGLSFWCRTTWPQYQGFAVERFDRGRPIKEDGPADAVVKKYLASGTGTTAEKV